MREKDEVREREGVMMWRNVIGRERRKRRVVLEYCVRVRDALGGMHTEHMFCVLRGYVRVFCVLACGERCGGGCAAVCSSEHTAGNKVGC